MKYKQQMDQICLMFDNTTNSTSLKKLNTSILRISASSFALCWLSHAWILISSRLNLRKFNILLSDYDGRMHWDKHTEEHIHGLIFKKKKKSFAIERYFGL